MAPHTAPIHLRLTKVRLERFKAAFKPPDPITFRPFNIIIGRNGSGKSTVLEGLQWVDTALRLDVRQACDPYHGVHDLVNLRSQSRELYFKIDFEWKWTGPDDLGINYNLRIKEADEDGRPEIAEEDLWLTDRSGTTTLIETIQGVRHIRPSWQREAIAFTIPDKLAMTNALVSLRPPADLAMRSIAALLQFWSNAVFLRLSPIGIAQGSRPDRKSFEPLLDQEGKFLPALLGELTTGELVELTEAIRRILPDIRGVQVTTPPRRGEEAYFSLLERMPSRGRAGRYQFPIPAWMLSEGTRRITAILALLQHNPPPSLLCIEEIENGLDPWSVRGVLNELRSASRAGIQVILTTHSPWVLDHVEVDDILHVERTEGETVYKRFSDRDSVKAYQGQIPPGAIYVTEG